MSSKNGLPLGEKRRMCERQDRLRSKGRGLGAATVGEKPMAGPGSGLRTCVCDETMGYRLLQHAGLPRS